LIGWLGGWVVDCEDEDEEELAMMMLLVS